MRWGPLVSPPYEDQIKWSQSGRWYHWRYEACPGLNNDLIRKHSSNTHICPATKNVRNAVLSLKRDDLAELSGYLVDLSGVKGRGKTFTWNTSRNRSDRGDGSCEVMYVTQVIARGEIYE